MQVKGALETVPVRTLGFGHGVGPKREQPAKAHCLLGGLQVVTVDVKNKKVVFKDGFKLEYSKLLLAPGSRWGPPLCLLLGISQDGGGL